MKSDKNIYKLLSYFIKVISVLDMIFLICPLSYSAVITVGPSGDYHKIQHGINASSDGDEIIVSQGKYTENIKFNGKNIILRSTDPTDTNTVAMTIIDGNQADAVVTFSGTELPICVLSGFTITNGKAHSGGGICGYTHPNYTLATIRNNTITGNSAHYGGGLYGCNGTIQNNTITENSALYGGGGLSECNGSILNNTIIGNSATDSCGGVGGCHGLIINCIIWDNSATNYPQIGGSAKPFYSCIQNWDGSGRGNISDNPGFVNPTNKNFHLQPNSPCIDKGNTYYLIGEVCRDMDGECRLAGSSVDMGADEYGSSLDSDGDFLSDNDETTRSCNINNPDTDGDGLIDGAEVLRGTNPLITDLPSGILIPSNYPNIQQGIFMALPGENVTISSGTYNENLYFGGKNIVLQSTNPLDINTRNNTIIDGNAQNPVIRLRGIESENCKIQGLTIKNGYSIDYGGGICGGNYFQRTLAIIQNNTITENIARDDGGGLYYCNGTIQNNTITGNSAKDNAGGLYYCNGTIQNNTITGNSAARSAGGLCYCNGTIQNNTISGNSAPQAGGGVYECNGTIQNNIITGNSAPGSDIAFSGAGGGLYWCDGIIQNNTITGNSAVYGGGLCHCNGTMQNNSITENSASSGGGLSMCNGTIQNDTITSNSASYYGGGLSDCNGTIQNNSITENSASYGGGLSQCIGTIQKNTIAKNYASWGGGLYRCDGTIQNNIITGNYTSDKDGGGLYWCIGKIQNNTITRNSASNSGGGLALCNGTIQNCIIWGNLEDQLYLSSTPSYSCIKSWSGGGTGNINSDPQFVDSTTNNYHLKSSSPCIDAGCLIAGLTKDFEDNPRPYNGTTKPRGDGSDYDIGAYEYSILTLNYQDINDYLLGNIVPSPEIIQQMDVNNDGKVDVADLVYFILHKK